MRNDLSSVISNSTTILPVFIINMVGQDVVINIMKALPTFVTHGLEVAGGVLPALGFALIMNMIGKNKLIPSYS